MVRFWELLRKCQSRAGDVKGGSLTVEPEADGLVLYLLGIDANVTGGSHPRCATGGDPASRQESSCGRTVLTGLEQLLLVPFPFPSGCEQCSQDWQCQRPLARRHSTAPCPFARSPLSQ